MHGEAKLADYERRVFVSTGQGRWEALRFCPLTPPKAQESTVHGGGDRKHQTMGRKPLQSDLEDWARVPETPLSLGPFLRNVLDQ